MAKSRKNKSADGTKVALERQVIDFYNRENHVPYNYKQVSAAVGADTPKLRSKVVEVLEELALEGYLIETTPGKFKATTRSTVADGVFAVANFFKPAGKKRSVYDMRYGNRIINSISFGLLLCAMGLVAAVVYVFTKAGMI